MTIEQKFQFHRNCVLKMNFRYFFLAHRSSHMTMFLIQNCTSITSTVKNCEQNSIDNLFRYFSLFGSSFSTVISTREVDFLISKVKRQSHWKASICFASLQTGFCIEQLQWHLHWFIFQEVFVFFFSPTLT